MTRLWLYYVVGAIGWFVIFFWLFGDPIAKTPYYFAHALCLVVLVVNCFFHWKPYQPAKYKVEESVYKYVERNTYYLIMAITVFLLISTSQNERLFPESVDFKLIVYSQAAAVGFCIVVLALIWMPTAPESKGIVHLRHIKTLFYTYGISLFFIGPAEVFLNMRQALAQPAG